VTQKIDLIGATKKPPKISQAEFDNLIEQVVYRPLTFPKAVSLCFCRQCGSHGEITQEYAKGLAKILFLFGEETAVDVENSKELRMHYFVTNRCEICFCEEIPLSVEIHKIDFKA
jgi:hypothetical protein